MAVLERDRLLALMDLNMAEMYRAITRATPGGEVEERDGVTLTWSPLGHALTNMAIVSGVTTPDAVRGLTDEFYRGPRRLFSVWAPAHGAPVVADELAGVGFHEFTQSPAMILLAGDRVGPSSPSSIEVRAVAGDEERIAYADIMAAAYAVYGYPERSTAAHFARLDSLHGPATQGFLVCAGGRPVAGATLYAAHGVGGIGWVGARPEVFGCRYGELATWAVVEEGWRRGVRFMSLQASPMGAPVYRRMGFSTPGAYRVFAPRD